MERNGMMEDKNEKKSIVQRWQSLKGKRGFKVLTNKFFIVTFFFLLLVLFFSNNSLISWGISGVDVLRQERLIRQYHRDIRNVEEKLKELTSNKDSLEKFAREQYYFQESEEEVFIVED